MNRRSLLPSGTRPSSPFSTPTAWLSIRTPDVKEIEVSRFLHCAVGLKPSAG